MRDLRTGAFLGTASLMAGLGPFVLPGRSTQLLAAATAFCVPAALPLFFSDRGLGLAAVTISLGLVALGSIAGVFVVETETVRRALLVRNLQLASLGALCAALLSGILWARDLARGDARA